jgi:hypothetical protein
MLRKGSSSCSTNATRRDTLEMIVRLVEIGGIDDHHC